MLFSCFADDEEDGSSGGGDNDDGGYNGHGSDCNNLMVMIMTMVI